RIAGIVARFIGAEDLGNVPESVHLICHATLEESFFFQKRRRTFDVVIGREHARAHFSFIWTLTSGNQPRARIEERTEAVPIALLPCRSGDYVVSGGQDGIDRAHVVGFGLRCWSARCCARRALRESTGRGKQEYGKDCFHSRPNCTRKQVSIYQSWENLQSYEKSRTRMTRIPRIYTGEQGESVSVSERPVWIL